MEDNETLFEAEAFVYKCGARSSEGHKAGSWTLDSPMVPDSFVKVESNDSELSIQLWQRSGGKSSLLCQTTVSKTEIKEKGLDTFCEPVIDSSRYWVLRLVNPKTSAIAHLGVGFGDRSVAFDFKATLQDRIRYFDRHDGKGLGDTGLGSLQLQEGQTIKISIKTKKPASTKKHVDDSTGGVAAPSPARSGLRPPPPSATIASSSSSPSTGGLRAPPPPAASASSAASASTGSGSASAVPTATPTPTPTPSESDSVLPNDVASNLNDLTLFDGPRNDVDDDEWGDFQ